MYIFFWSEYLPLWLFPPYASSGTFPALIFVGKSLVGEVKEKIGGKEYPKAEKYTSKILLGFLWEKFRNC